MPAVVKGVGAGLPKTRQGSALGCGMPSLREGPPNAAVDILRPWRPGKEARTPGSSKPVDRGAIRELVALGRLGRHAAARAARTEQGIVGGVEIAAAEAPAVAHHGLIGGARDVGADICVATACRETLRCRRPHLGTRQGAPGARAAPSAPGYQDGLRGSRPNRRTNTRLPCAGMPAGRCRRTALVARGAAVQGPGAGAMCALTSAYAGWFVCSIRATKSRVSRMLSSRYVWR